MDHQEGPVLVEHPANRPRRPLVQKAHQVATLSAGRHRLAREQGLARFLEVETRVPNPVVLALEPSVRAQGAIRNHQAGLSVLVQVPRQGVALVLLEVDLAELEVDLVELEVVLEVSNNRRRARSGLNQVPRQAAAVLGPLEVVLEVSSNRQLERSVPGQGPRQAAAVLVRLEVVRVESEGDLEVSSNRLLALLVLVQDPPQVVVALVPLELAQEVIKDHQAVPSVRVPVPRLQVAVALALLEVALEAINSHPVEVLVPVQVRSRLVVVSLAPLVVAVATKRSQAVVSLALSAVAVAATKRIPAAVACLVLSVPEPTNSHPRVRSVLVPAQRSP